MESEDCKGRTTGCKWGLGSTATGYWGRSVFRRVYAEQEQARQRALLQDQLLGGGMRAALWQPALEGNRCACYKDSQEVADKKCKSCHGVIGGHVPGYHKFGYETLFMSCVDDDLTLTDVQVTREFKSAKVQLVSGATTGTIESGDKPFTRSAIGSVWEYEVVEFIRIANLSTVTTEYSLDSGMIWQPLNNLPTENPSSGTIRFRSTLTRTSANILSPLFEIVRARYATIDVNEVSRSGPWILVMYQRPSRTLGKDEHGASRKHGSLSMWTAGLSMFDPTVTVGSMAELIQGPNNVVEVMDGVLAGYKYIATDWQASDPFAYIVVEQSFKIRVSSGVGPYSLIF